MMATLLSQWLTPNGVPEPYPPNWHMDRILRHVWMDLAKTEDRLEVILSDKHSIGHRSLSWLQENARNGHLGPG